MNNIIRIKDSKEQLHSWVIVDTIVCKYNPAVTVHEVELQSDRRVFTYIYVKKCYTGNNGKTYYRGTLNTGNDIPFAKAPFMYIKVS